MKKFGIVLEMGRIQYGKYSSRPSERYGAFEVQGPCGPLRIIAADAADPVTKGWEHVSVSTASRPPNWMEMCWVKELFWEDEDCVVQFHPRKSEYVNYHPFCLHMWRYVKGFPTPPTILVGPKT